LENPTPSTKYCKRCNSIKPINSFSIDKKSKDGHNFYCKDCCNTDAKIRRDEHKNDPVYIYKRIKSRQQNYQKQNKPHAKPFELELGWFVDWYNSQELKCVYCDIPNEHCPDVAEVFAINGKQLSIDCVDNDLGYVNNNIVLACHRCNATKNVLFSHDEMLYIGQNFIKPKWQKIVGDKLG